MDSGTEEELRDEYKERLYSRISMWVSIVLSTALVIWYWNSNPPDSEEVREMRLFFKANIMDVTKFIELPLDEQKGFAEQKTHPFYATYLKSSEVEKEKIKALIHISGDYTPYQYWFNIFFLWLIFITTFWFIGLMTEGAIILVRTENAKRKRNRSSGSNQGF